MKYDNVTFNNGLYCIPNAPRQNGDLWISVKNDLVSVLNPAGEYWRNRTFTTEQFQRELNERENQRDASAVPTRIN